MAGQVSKDELSSVLMQAMLAAKNLRPQRDRLLQLRRRLQQLSPGDGDAAKVEELASDLFEVSYIGIEAGARSIHTCLELAAENGARIALKPSFAVMPDELLYDALLTQRLPARPTTQTEAFARVESAFYAVKLPQEYHLPRCIEHLVGARPEPLVTAELTDYSGEDEDDPVVAVTDRLAKTDLADPAPAGTGEPPQAAAASSSVDLDKARTFLDRACTLASLAVKHIDLAVAVLSSFLDPKEVASLSDFTDRFAYISEVPTLLPGLAATRSVQRCVSPCMQYYELIFDLIANPINFLHFTAGRTLPIRLSDSPDRGCEAMKGVGSLALFIRADRSITLLSISSLQRCNSESSLISGPSWLC
jgi:hypothetical protein